MAVVIDSLELERLERASRAGRLLALALGQDEEILLEIEAGELHPAMAAWGLWEDEEGLATLAEEITREREGAAAPPLEDRL